MATTNLNLDTMASNSLQPSVTFNAGVEKLDAAVAGTLAIEFTTDANLTLTEAQYHNSALVFTDSPATLTAARDVIFPAHFPHIYVKNSTAQTLTLKKSGQTGVALAAGADGIFVSGATDVLRGSGGSGTVNSVNGDTGTVFVAVPIIIACSDETTALTTGTAKATFRMPYAMTLTGVRASVTTAPTGAVLTVDINEAGNTILSTKLTIDAGEKTSTTAAIPAVMSDTSLADDAEMTIDIDTVGSTVAGAGLKVMLIGYAT
jgi:hypothetical protein